MTGVQTCALPISTLENVAYAITKKSTKGFRLSLLQPLEKALSFDWIALAVTGGSNPPVIDSLTLSRQTVGTGVPVEFWAQATDPDTNSSQLTYRWTIEPSLGTITGEGGMVFWKLDQDPGQNTSITVTVNVTDGTSTVTKSQTFDVISELATGSTQPTPAPETASTTPQVLTQPTPSTTPIVVTPAPSSTPPVVSQPNASSTGITLSTR